jgi:glycosyltransferase involved in cell wall biosynthesis
MDRLEPLVSIVMPCYNAGLFLTESVSSVVNQVFQSWELIIVNDGSTDDSESVARAFSCKDKRIRVVSKDNGGYVSARLFGLKFISDSAQYLLFFDADDILHRDMIQRLSDFLDNNAKYGAVYCNHTLIDSAGNSLGHPDYGVRIRPTLFGMKYISEEQIDTPFIAIFCWASRMIEPMTMIRRKVYEDSLGWDVRFGKGKGNIGDGTLLFSEIALSWPIAYIHEYLYYYRKHSNQSTSDPQLNRNASSKVISIWETRIKEIDRFADFRRDIRAAIITYKYRKRVFEVIGSLKHNIRFYPFKAVGMILELICNYIMSLRLVMYMDTRAFKDRY